MMPSKRHRPGFRPFPFFLAAGFLMAAIVMWLWNAILPEVLGAKQLNYWQALGLLVLSRILFGGFGGGFKRSGKFSPDETDGNPWKRGFSNQWRNRWMNLSDEERAKIKEEMRRRCGPFRNREK